MRAVFITGTDTGVGKTIVTGLLARYLSDKGLRVITQKWIQTGCSGPASDIDAHLRLMGKRREEVKGYLQYVSPYIFRRASSPHLASKYEHKRINPKKITDSFKLLSRNFDFVIAEGTGGALVPFSEKGLVIDIAYELGLPFLVVAQNRLGAINHTLLTIEALKNRKARVLGVIFNNLKNEDGAILKDNPRIIKILSQETILGLLPWEPSVNKLYAGFIPTAEKILKSLKKYG